MSKEISAELGRLVKRLREKKGLSYHQQVTETGISDSYLSRLVHGDRRSPSLNVAFTLANVLDMNIEQLKESVDATTYEESKGVKLEELLLYCHNLTINDKVIDSDFKERILDLINLIVTSNSKSTFEVEDQILVMNAAEALKEAYHAQ